MKIPTAELIGTPCIDKLDVFELDHSRKNSFLECPRKYFYEYINHLRPRNSSTALRFGSCFHSMLEGYNRTIKAEGWQAEVKAVEAGLTLGKLDWLTESEGKDYFYDYRTFENCTALFLGYLNARQNDKQSMEILETEQVFETTMSTTEEESRYIKLVQSFTFIGKIDLVCKIDGTLSIIDYKTSSMYLGQAEKLIRKSPQSLGYVAGYMQEHDQRPSFMINDFAHCSARKNKAGEYPNVKQEFIRFPILYTDVDIANWRLHFLHYAALIQENMITGLWPMNLSSCNKIWLGGAITCPYLLLCEQDCHFDEMNLDEFIEQEWNPRDSLHKEEKTEVKTNVDYPEALYDFDGCDTCRDAAKRDGLVYEKDGTWDAEVSAWVCGDCGFDDIQTAERCF